MHIPKYFFSEKAFFPGETDIQRYNDHAFHNHTLILNLEFRIPAGFQIASASVIDGATLSATWTVETFTFSPTEVLTTGTDYYLVLGRSGAMDNVNYYKLTIDSLALYAGGTTVSYNGAAWGAETYDWYFEIYSNALVETSTQIINLITNYHQFFNDIESDIDSGIVSESYRDGDGTAKYEIEQLLQHGTTNLRRMLIPLDQPRNVYLYEEPERLLVNMYSLYTDGGLFDPDGARVRKSIIGTTVSLILGGSGFFAGIWVSRVERKLAVLEALAIRVEVTDAAISELRRNQDKMLSALAAINDKLDNHRDSTEQKKKKI